MNTKKKFKTVNFTHHNWFEKVKFLKPTKRKEMKTFQKLAECALGGRNMNFVTSTVKGGATSNHTIWV